MELRAEWMTYHHVLSQHGLSYYVSQVNREETELVSAIIVHIGTIFLSQAAI